MVYVEDFDKDEVLRRTCKAIEDSFWTRLLKKPAFKGYGEKHEHNCICCGQKLECFDHCCFISNSASQHRKFCELCSNVLVNHTQYGYIVDNGEYAIVLAEKMRLADKAIVKEKRALAKAIKP